MTNFKNMKIEINSEQTIEDVINSLTRLGYGQCFSSIQLNKFIICRDFGIFFDSDGDDYEFELITFADLKNME